MNLIFDESLIRSKLIPCDSPSRTILKDDYFTSSAVLFSIIPYQDKPYDLIIIHRTDKGLKHRGEMSFPGGKFDPRYDERLLDTALRETHEEIGISPKNIEILGCLNDFPTMTKYIITPFVAKINPNVELVREEREVKEIIKVPIEFFISKRNFREQAFDVDGQKFPVFYFNYFNKETNNKYLIWGATAHMIATFIEKIYNYKMSELGIKRFDLNRIRSLKDYLKHKNHITNKIK